MRLFSLIFILTINLNSFGQSIKGKVIDFQTEEPLPFVNIFIAGTNNGCSSDVNGVFDLKLSTPDSLNVVFSFVGYKRDTLFLQPDIINEIKLKPQNELQEFVLDIDFNPAIPIIQKTILNRKKNNPELNFNFSYTTYNKMYVYANTIDVEMEGTDSAFKSSISFLDRQYLMLLETVEENHHKKPGKDESKIMASRTSGLSSAMIPMLATELQSFSFYPNIIKIGDKQFISPIAKEGFSIYNYQLVEVYEEFTDTIFTIKFKPKRSVKSNALEGTLQITSDGFAIKSVSARPKLMDEFLDISINQLYKKTNSVWMPYQLNTSFDVSNLTTSGVKFEGKSYSYIDNVVLYEEIPKSWFSEFDVIIDEKAKDTTVLDSLRPIELTHKDSLTYHVIDSLGKAENLDAKLSSIDSWLKGRIPIGKFDLDFSKGLNYSEYEGLRLGVGLYTNYKLIKNLSFGGYFAYGFKDKKWKYGGETELRLVPKKDLKLKLSYQNDIYIAGSTEVGESNQLLNADQYYRLYTFKYIGGQKLEGVVNFQLKDFKIKLNGSFNQIEPKFDYAYVLQQNESTVVSTSSYFTNTLGASVAYQPFTKLMFDGSKIVNLGSKWPVLHLSVEQTIGQSNVNYTRLLCKITGKFRVPKLGNSIFSIHGGWVNNDVPLPFLFYQKSTAKQLGVSAFESFETASIYSYVSNEFVSVFIDHNFGKFLDKGMLQPEFVLYNGLGWGSKMSKSKHLYSDVSTFEKGYYETGIKLINLLKSGFSGFGIGGFYKYGPYANSIWKDNLVAKVTLNIGL